MLLTLRLCVRSAIIPAVPISQNGGAAMSEKAGYEQMKRSGLIPHLVVKDGAKAIEFYKAALGAIEIARMPLPDGRVMHAALQIGESMLFLCDDFPEHCGGVSRAPKGPSPVTLHLNVSCCDTALSQATTAGATVTMAAEDMFWGDRYGQIIDPFGHAWSFSSPLTAEQKAEAEKKWAAIDPFGQKAVA
jgi:PhnB protein